MLSAEYLVHFVCVMTFFTRLCLTVESFAGGFLKTVNFMNTVSGPHIYKRTSASHDICLKKDTAAPIHCKERGTCSQSPLRLDLRVRKTRNVTVDFSGWFDPFPPGGRVDQASGIKTFTIAVHEVVESTPTSLKMKLVSYSNKNINAKINIGQVHMLLPNYTGLFAVSLDVLDNVDNFKKARRFVLYDNESYIKSLPYNLLRVETGYIPTNYTWQIHHGQTCISWKGRYYNTFHKSTNFLRPILPDHNRFYKGIYEQHTGLLKVEGTPNIDGITSVSYRIRKELGPFGHWKYVTSFLSESFCDNFHVVDGDTLYVELKNTDIMSNTFHEIISFHVDRSVPSIIDLGLYKNGHNSLFVHSQKDMATMAMQFSAMDKHSGLHSVAWQLGTTRNGNEIGSGYLPVGRTNLVS